MPVCLAASLRKGKQHEPLSRGREAVPTSAGLSAAEAVHHTWPYAIHNHTHMCDCVWQSQLSARQADIRNAIEDG